MLSTLIYDNGAVIYFVTSFITICPAMKLEYRYTGRLLHTSLLFIFRGYTTELKKKVQVCECKIVCSYQEELPLNVMEAVLCSKLVVASSTLGHRELVKDRINRFLVEADGVDGVEGNSELLLAIRPII